LKRVKIIAFQKNVLARSPRFILASQSLNAGQSIYLEYYRKADKKSVYFVYPLYYQTNY